MKKFILFFAALFFVHPAFADSSIYEKVKAAGEIKCGYGIWNPILSKDIQTNEVKGVARDIMDAIGRKTALKINWAEEAPWGTIIEGLATHRYNMICTSIGALSARAQVVDFSTPVFYLPVYVIARADDKRFDKNLSAINDPKIKIGVLEGEGTSVFAREKFSKAQTVAIPQMSDYSLLLEDLKTGKTDVTFMSAETFDAYNKKNPGVLKIALEEKPLSVTRIAFALPKNDANMKSMIDTAINELQDEGMLDIILDKYDPSRKLFLRLSQPYQMPK